MKKIRLKILIVIFIWLSSLAIVAVVSSRIATRIADEKHNPWTVEEIVDLGRDWEFVTARQYLDGGSWDLGFQEINGHFIFLRIDYSLGLEHEYRKFYLRKNLQERGDDFVEIVRGSDLERKVIDLIDNSADLNTDLYIIMPDKDAIVALLKSRDLEIIIGNPREY